MIRKTIYGEEGIIISFDIWSSPMTSNLKKRLTIVLLLVRSTYSIGVQFTSFSSSYPLVISHTVWRNKDTPIMLLGTPRSIVVYIIIKSSTRRSIIQE